MKKSLSSVVFGSLVVVLIVSAIPYGTVEPWWKAAFVCAVFAVCIVAIVEFLLSGSTRITGLPVLLPMLALSGLAFVQTLSFGSGHVWNAISADPFQTRFFTLQMLALTVFLALLYRYAQTERRVRVLVHAILAVAVVSAVFGILRQTTQQETGFVLPLLKQNQGYGQFINKNHFAFLMEMAFGLALGIVVAGGVKRERVMIYVALLLPIWTGLVLANSRGGILAMLVQVVVVGLLVSSFHSSRLARSGLVRVVLTGVLVVVVVAGAFWVGGDRLATNFEATASEFNRDAGDALSARDGASRREIWTTTLKMFAAHPFLGVGLGGYWIVVTAHHDASGRLTPQEAHNDYLELLASGGLVGLALGVWFVVVVVRAIRKNFIAEKGPMSALRIGAVLGLAGVAAHSLVDFGLHITINALVFLTLIMIATRPQLASYARKSN